MTLSKKKCPICNKPVHEQHRPFCSKRCADVDLGHWLKGSYVIESQQEPDEEDIVKAIETGNFKGDLPQ